MVNELRLKIADFLNIEIIEIKFLFLNFWHVIHFILGAIIMFFILNFSKKLEIKKKFLLLLILLIFYEVIEAAFIISGSNLFRQETGTDILLDLILGFLGGFLFFRLASSARFFRFAH